MKSSDTDRLAGRRIVITGAASGIGEATAVVLQAHGAQVALVDTDEAKLARVAAATRGLPLALDITDEDAVTAAVKQAAGHMGGVDGLVNVAGINLKQPIETMTAAEWRRVIDVNLTGSFLLCKAVVPLMRTAGTGSIVNIASGAGLLPTNPGTTAYSASKGGVIAFTRSLALELAPVIRVNAICPGAVDTPMLPASYRAASSDPAKFDRYAMRRLATPEEIANAVLFLTSTEASFVTGSILAVDGGRTFH